jgi:dTDP-4-dehydrorhamnose 3,5-epimerase
MNEFSPLSIEGAWLFDSPLYLDERGFFREWFKESLIQKKIGREFKVAQASLSKSKKGTLRGIHFSLAPQGQAKWITCVNGSILDVVVDIRPNSPTFRNWCSNVLQAEGGGSVFISEGLGHAFLALEDDTVISYLLSSPYSPSEEFGINPRDKELAIAWPDMPLILSDKDASAPTLNEFLRVD